MTTNNAPGVVIENVVSLSQPIRPINIGVAGMLAVTSQGPLREPTLVRSFDEFVEIFGTYSSESDAAYQARLFFENGGSDLYVSRVAHYSDLTDNTSFAGAASTLDLDNEAAATTLTVNAKHVGLDGDNISVEIVHNPLCTTSLSASIAASDTIVNLNSVRNLAENSVIKVEFGPDPENLDEAIALANSIKSVFNAHLADATVHDGADAANPVATANATDLATLIALANSIRTKYTAHRQVGAGVHNSADTTNVVDAQLATATDLASAIAILKDVRDVYEAHRVNATHHNSADNTNFAHNQEFAKVLSVVNNVSGSTVIKQVVVDAGFSNAFSTSNVKVFSQEFDLLVYKNDELLETFSALSIESDADRYVLTVVNHEDTGSKLIEVEDPSASSAGLGTDIPAEIDPTNLASGGDETTGLIALDLIGESAGSTGLFAFDDVDVNLLFVAPSSENLYYNEAFVKAAASYCQEKLNCVLLAECDPSLRPEQARAAILEQSINNSFCAVFYNRLKVVNRDADASSESKFVSCLGAVAGKIADVDSNFGPHESAAGDAPFGNLRGVVGVERLLTDKQRGLLNDANINPIHAVRGRGVLIYGVRTQDESLEFRYLNNRRMMIFIQQSIARAMQSRVFRNNNANLWRQIRNVIQDFLQDQLQKNALRGNSSSEAYFVRIGEVDGVQTPTDTLNGRLVGRIGVALVRPAEFLVFKFSQIGTSVSVESEV